jgi:hypothetical protein
LMICAVGVVLLAPMSDTYGVCFEDDVFTDSVIGSQGKKKT